MSDLGPSRYRIVGGAAVPIPVPVPAEPRRRRSPARIARVVVASLCWAYGLAICAFHGAMLLAPAPSWPVHLILYGPRWVAALPLILIVPAALLLRLRWCALPLILGLYSFAAILGFNVPWERYLVAGGSPDGRLRVLTCNVQGHDLKVRVLADYIQASRADVVCIQENMLPDIARALGLGDWSTRAAGEFCVISRHPIVGFDEFRVEEGRSRRVAVRAHVEHAGRRIPVMAIHLMTPRWGLQDVIDHRWRGIPSFRKATDVQELESREIRRKAEEALDPVIVAGDFNLSAEQPIFRRDWSDLRDAFAWTNWGLGHTMFTRSIGLRIDHVLCGPGWTPVSCEVGPDVGSAHRPVVAELAEGP